MISECRRCGKGRVPRRVVMEVMRSIDHGVVVDGKKDCKSGLRQMAAIMLRLPRYKVQVERSVPMYLCTQPHLLIQRSNNGTQNIEWAAPRYVPEIP